MIKISVEELDAFILAKGAEVTQPEIQQKENDEKDPMSGGANMYKDPPLRKAVDKAISTVTGIGAGIAGGAASVLKLKPVMNYKQVE